MLIPSPRHRAEDLAIWREQEAADIAAGEPSARVRRSLDVIRDFLARGDAYCGVSGGKDSIATAALVRSVAPVRLVHIEAGVHANPDTRRVIEALPWPVEITHIDYRGLNDSDANRVFFAAFDQCGDRYFSGVRSDESTVRRMRFVRWGESTGRTCAPLSLWSESDVFRFLAAHDLPVHPAYAMNGEGRWPRRWLRVDELAGDGGAHRGRAEWEREYYGDVLRRADAASAHASSRASH